LEIKKEWITFSKYIWHFVNGSPVQNDWKNAQQVPVKTDISDAMSKDLKREDLSL
jgi:DNA-3-methyladenine glycosylase I